MTRPILFALLFAFSSLFGASARAAEKREVPDYDGRAEPPTTARDVLLTSLRVALAPAYFASEYVLRRPLGYVVATSERHGLPALVLDVFTFGPEANAGVFPTAFLDFGFSPSVGFYAFYNDAFARGHDLRLRGATFGRDWLSGSFSERFDLSSNGADRFVWEASGLRRPDYAFFGLGPNSRQSQLVRYGKDTLEARAFVEKRLFRTSSFRAELGLRSVDFREGGFGGDPTLDEAIRSSQHPEPPGYSRGYTLFQSSISAAYDDRRPRPAPGSGLRLQAEAAHAANLRTTEGFVSYGGTAAGFLDLNDRQRVLSLSVSTRFVDPVGGSEVPFTELATLGGEEPMRGLYPERVADRSVVAAGLSYRWPIWIWLDGAMNFEVGNAFGEHLSGFKPGLLRFSGSLGVETNGSRDQVLQVLAGVGSETFESGGKIDSFRLSLGTTHGF